MTIGFGDFVPGNSYIYNVVDDMSEKEANFKLVFGSVYILLGMGILAMCINLVQEKISSQVSYQPCYSLQHFWLFRPEILLQL